MVSAASLLGRRSSYSRPSDAPHRLHGRRAVAPPSDAPPCRYHPYHLAADGRITPYDRPSDAPHRLHDRPAVAPFSDGRISPYDRPAVAPRPLHPSDAPHRLHDRPAVAPSSDGRISPYDRPAVAPRPLHPSDAPHHLHDRPAVAPSSDGRISPYDLPFKPPRYFPSDPTVIPGGPSCDPVSSRPTIWDNRNHEPAICPICTRRGNHGGSECPFMVLAFDGFMNSPPEDYCLRFRTFVMKKTQGIHGFGVRYYTSPCLEDIERNPADAMSLHKDGIYLVRITDLMEDTSEPELLYRLFVKYGPVTNTIVFPEQALGFVSFVREEDAQKAIKELNSCGFGHLMWATESPDPTVIYCWGASPA